MDLQNLGGDEPDQLMAACNSKPNCAAFNSDGWLKNSTANMQPSTCDLYVKHAVAQPPRLSVWPQPIHVRNGTAMILVSPNLQFKAITPDPDLTAAFARYTNLIFSHAVPAGDAKRVHFPKAQPTLTTLYVTVSNLTVPLQLNVDESYALNIPADGSAATLTANTVYGAYRGLETFSQLVHFDYDLQVYRLDFAPLIINDAPRFAWRGLLIDTSRHFQPLQSIFHIIDTMSYAKLNVLHWHIVDYQSWPIQSLAYPLLWSAAWSPGERYTLADAAAVVEFGRQRGVLVVPEFDTPGHADSVCVGYPEACPAPECTSPLNPATNFTFNLIRGVFSEWASVFPSKFAHLGGDEVSTDCWSSTPSIAAWMSAQGFTPDQTYEYFVIETDKIVNALGKSTVRWQEVWNHFGTSLPADTIIHVWLDHPTLANVTANGYYGILSDNDVYYLDHLTLTWVDFYDNDLLAGITNKTAQSFVLGGGKLWLLCVHPQGNVCSYLEMSSRVCLHLARQHICDSKNCNIARQHL